MDTGERVVFQMSVLPLFFNKTYQKCLKRHGKFIPFHPVMLLLQNYSKEIIREALQNLFITNNFGEYLPVPDTMLRTGNTSLSKTQSLSSKSSKFRASGDVIPTMIENLAGYHGDREEGNLTSLGQRRLPGRSDVLG